MKFLNFSEGFCFFRSIKIVEVFYDIHIKTIKMFQIQLYFFKAKVYVSEFNLVRLIKTR